MKNDDYNTEAKAMLNQRLQHWLTGFWQCWHVRRQEVPFIKQIYKESDSIVDLSYAHSRLFSLLRLMYVTCYRPTQFPDYSHSMKLMLWFLCGVMRRAGTFAPRAWHTDCAGSGSHDGPAPTYTIDISRKSFSSLCYSLLHSLHTFHLSYLSLYAYTIWSQLFIFPSLSF
jgi:hypothetical protein